MSTDDQPRSPYFDRNRAARGETILDEYGPALRSETIPCVTEQWNHPFPADQPFARAKGDAVVGECTVCGLAVRAVRFAPDNPSTYSFRALPHARVLRYYEVSEDVLDAFIQMRVWEWGS